MRLKFEENQPGLEFAEFNFGFVKMKYSIEKVSDYVASSPKIISIMKQDG